MRVRDAGREEAGLLSGLALRSKAHWGYPEEFLARCVDELTLTPSRCGSGEVRVGVAGGPDGQVLGFHALRAGSPVGEPEIELEMLYVDPTRMGRGVGRQLLHDAVDLARQGGATSLRIAADPFAESFYVHHGAVRTGSVPSGSIPGRSLPLLTLPVAAASPHPERPLQ